MLAENRRLRREKEDEVDAIKLKAAATISKFRNIAASNADKLKTKSKEKDELIEGIHGLAEDVAVEYCSLKRYAKAETECLRKKSDNRLTNLKKSKERESGLRDSLDSLKEEHEVMSAAAQDEIADLKKTISCLETQLADAKKELTVSKAFTIGIVIVANDN
jgi:uncharacterized phage infection (PIP) family protein YhgE